MSRVLILAVLALVALFSEINGQCTKYISKTGLWYTSRRLPGTGNTHWRNPTKFVSDLTSAPGGRGYCSKKVSSLTSFTNRKICRGGTKSNIAFDLQLKLYEPSGAMWDIRWGPDVTTGFVVLLDNKIWQVELLQNNYGLWWQGRWNHPHVRDIKPKFVSQGFHTIRIVGGERCCDGIQSINFKRGNQKWSPATQNALNAICKLPPVCKTCSGCKIKNACNGLAKCAWVGNSCIAKCSSCSACSGTKACATLGSKCFWTGKTCANACTTCGKCTHQQTCNALTGCSWKSGKCVKQCWNKCSCAVTKAHCGQMGGCKWAGNNRCVSSCLQCSCSTSATQCASFGGCTWANGKCTKKCTQCSCGSTSGQCSSMTNCAWVGNKCMNLCTTCTCAKSQGMCNLVNGCQWTGGQCVIKPKTCTTCSGCSTSGSCNALAVKIGNCAWANGKCVSLPCCYYCKCQAAPKNNPTNVGRFGPRCDTLNSPHIGSFISHKGWSPDHEFGLKNCTVTPTPGKPGRPTFKTKDGEWVCKPQ